MGIFASKLHFFKLKAASYSEFRYKVLVIIIGSPIIDCIAFFIKKGDVFEKSPSCLLIRKKYAPSYSEKAFFFL